LGFRVGREGGKPGEKQERWEQWAPCAYPAWLRRRRAVAAIADWHWGHSSAFGVSVGHGQAVGAQTAAPHLGRRAGRQQCGGAGLLGCVPCHHLKNQTCFSSIGSCGPSKERKVVSGRRV